MFMFNSKLNGLLIDFLIVAVICVYYRISQFWVYSSDIEIVMSQETMDDLSKLSEFL